jgi:hypothetical protein
MQASVRALAIGAGIDFGRRYKDQSITKLAKLMVAVSTCPKRVPLTDIKQAREAEPYLARFEDDWATGQIVRQYINGKQKYENAKANGKVKVGEKRQRISAASPVANKRSKRLPSPNDDEEESVDDGFNGGSNGSDGRGMDEDAVGNFRDERE